MDRTVRDRKRGGREGGLTRRKGALDAGFEPGPSAVRTLAPNELNAAPTLLFWLTPTAFTVLLWQTAVFNKRALKPRCTLPAQQLGADAGEHSRLRS